MPSESDRRFAEVMAALTGPAGMLAAGPDAAGRMIAPGLPDTLAGLFRMSCARHGAADAIVAGNERLSFTGIDALSDEVAQALAGGWSIARGDRVAIAMRNCPAWILVYMAIAKAGGIAVLLNGWWTREEMTQALALTTPRLVIADAERAARVPPHAGRLVELAADAPAAHALAPLLAQSRGALPTVSGEDDATILFTSGSTAAPKGAVSTQRAVVTAAWTFVSVTAAILEQYHGGDRANLPGPPALLVAVPLFHVTGEVPVLLASIALGRRLVLMPRWDAGEALRLIERERISYFVGVPTMSLELMQHPGRDRFDTSSLLDIAAGGAPRPPAHVPRLKAAFPNGNPMIGYGLTETNAVGCSNLRDRYLARPGSTGHAQWPFTEVAILGPEGPLSVGKTGEIGIRSAANMRGYWNDAGATAAAFAPGGYVRTGDLGYLDADGYLFIVDRAKDIIIRGGENISAQEVEQALYAHPAVAEACVFALPDERLGEVPAAAVRVREPIAREAVVAFLAGRLARFKLPVCLWLGDTPLPRLGTGKLDRRAIRARHTEEAGGAR